MRAAPEEDVVRARMIEHDELVGALLKKLDELGVADNTIVVYTTDNGNELMLWPDGGYAPYRGEKGGTWEGGVRVPMLIKWPGKIKPGSVSNGIQNHEDVFATLAAAAGLPDLAKELLSGKKLGDTTYKVHLDGFNNLDHWTGKSAKSARRVNFYYDETDLMAIRVDDMKMHIGVKPHGSWWDQKYYPSVPYLFNLRMDPMEKMDPESEEWGYAGRKFLAHKMWALNAAGPFIAEHIQTPRPVPAQPGCGLVEPQEEPRRGHEEARIGEGGRPSPSSRLADVHVSAAEDDTDALARDGNGAGERGREPERSGRLDDQLHALPKEAHRGDDLLVGHRHDVVDVATDDRERDLPERGRPRAVRDRIRPLASLKRPGSKRARRVIRAFRLDPDHLASRGEVPRRDRRAREQPAPSARNEQAIERSRLLDQLHRRRPLACDDVRMVERRDDRGCAFRLNACVRSPRDSRSRDRTRRHSPHTLRSPRASRGGRSPA